MPSLLNALLFWYRKVVGDMDGSGSRGITWLLRAGGVWMRTTNEWLDWAKDEHPLSNAIMHATHSLDYKVTLLYIFFLVLFVSVIIKARPIKNIFLNGIR